ncbi:hypothetical protein LTR08_004297 [Meristemomyces frigidus]|nr:hypothetical protein LTR08_004297 [Meristemomyces frigidus]
MPRNPCTYLPRRLQIVATLTLFLLASIYFLGTSTTVSPAVDPYLAQIPYAKQLQSSAHHVVDNLDKHLPALGVNVNAPQWLNPFRGAAHTPPPQQANSSSGEARWYSDFKWRNPFSSSVTLDEERAVLPPLRERPPVYTYFDAAGRRKDAVSKQAEQDLLHVWRRAWWAKGFKPIVLGRPEALNHPQYRAVQTLELAPELEMEMMRWLAWANMGTGILCNWLALPMAAHDDPLLSFLRRGEYPELTRYAGLDNGLFVGTKAAVEAALKATINSPDVKTVKSIVEAIPADTITTDSSHSGIAFYSTAIISSKYAAIASKFSLDSTVSEGMSMLPPLINSHLHMTWQNTFTSGIAVLKPLAEHTTTLIAPAIDIARNLSQCPETPIPASCPPNRPRCKPCVSSHMLISTPPVFRNTSTLFTIGTIPHPYTLTSLRHDRTTLDVKFIRRETSRDAWILAATKELLGTGLSSFARLVSVKEIVASEYGSARGLWLTAEYPPEISSSESKDLEELDWTFGFSLPRSPMDDGKSETPVPGRERRPPPPKQEFGDSTPPTDAELANEVRLMELARRHMGSAAGNLAAELKVREVVEAWNLADAEAWKFIRAWEARRTLERRGWVEEEDEFSKGVFHRWIDKIT